MRLASRWGDRKGVGDSKPSEASVHSGLVSIRDKDLLRCPLARAVSCRQSDFYAVANAARKRSVELQ